MSNKKQDTSPNLTEEETKNTEDLINITMYVDPSALCPGQLVYTIEEIKPTDKTPYSIYRPVPRIITQIHNPSATPNGTLFFTVAPVIEQTLNIKDKRTIVKAEETTIYSPLTKEHAIFICNKLNEQMKHYYMKITAKRKIKTR